LLLTASILFGMTATSAFAQENRRLPGQEIQQTGSVAGTVTDQDGRGIPGALVEARSVRTQDVFRATTTSEGIYRLNSIPYGTYDVAVTREGYVPSTVMLSLPPLELKVLDVQLTATGPTGTSPLRLGGIPESMQELPPLPSIEDPAVYPGFPMPQPEMPGVPALEIVPSTAENFMIEPYRWTVDMPVWQRYDKEGEFPYVKSHWYDPFNRNKIKGDYPIFGQRWFFDFTGTSTTQVDGRRLPTPSNVAAQEPGSQNFFGRGEQAFVDQEFRLSFDLFRGDTSFRPVDFLPPSI
jgi:hypothetical protein